MNAGIVGAGIMGCLLAYQLSRNGWNVSLFDQDDSTSCSRVAAGLLTPMAELEKCDSIIFQLGEEALLSYWPEIIKSLKKPVFFQKNGSLVLAHPRDEAELTRFINIINMKINQPCDVLSKADIVNLESEITKFEKGYYFSNEGHLDNQELLNELKNSLEMTWYLNTEVKQIEPGKIICEKEEKQFDCVFDCRGLGGKNNFKNLRGVRGELLWLHAPAVSIQRPVRLLHPRYGLYIVPRSNHVYILGASEIESEDKSPISVRTTLELLSAANYVHPGFAESRVIKSAVNCRPTLNNHLPEIKFRDGLIAINGLYRHGFLIAPTLVEDVMNYLQDGMNGVKYKTLWTIQ